MTPNGTGYWLMGCGRCHSAAPLTDVVCGDSVLSLEAIAVTNPASL